MQKTWATDDDKCTFIVLAGADHVVGGECLPAEIERMAGDVNLFFNDHDDSHFAEVEVMIAEAAHRGKGFGKEAVLLMLQYGVETLGVTKYTAKIGFANSASLGLFAKLGFVEVSRCEHFEEVTLELPVVAAAATALQGAPTPATAAAPASTAVAADGGRSASDKLQEHWARINAVQATYPAAAGGGSGGGGGSGSGEITRCVQFTNKDLATETSTDSVSQPAHVEGGSGGGRGGGGGGAGAGAAESESVLGPEPGLLLTSSSGKVVHSALTSPEELTRRASGGACEKRRISWGEEVTTFFPRAISRSTLQFGVGLGMGDVPICDHAGCHGCDLCQNVSPSPKPADYSGKVYPNSAAANQRWVCSVVKHIQEKTLPSKKVCGRALMGCFALSPLGP